MIDLPRTPLVQAALSLATEAHRGQTRWGGESYIVHPIRVAKRAVELYDQKYSSVAYDDPKTRAICDRERELVAVVGLVHDAAEDNPAYTEESIALHLSDQGLLNAEEHAAVINALTRLNKHHYPDYLAFTLAAKGFWLSKPVKQADVSDNLADKAKGSMRDKYLLALHILES